MTITEPPPPTDQDAPPAGLGARRPPHDLGAELALIGAALTWRSAAVDALTLVDVDDFYRPVHRDVWAAIAEVVAETGAADQVLVIDAASRAGADRHVVVQAVLDAIAESGAPSRVDRSATLVREHANARAVINAASTLTDALLAGDTRAARQARARLDELNQATASGDRLLVTSGATFILDQAVDLEARWGAEGSVLWARGESLMICAPPGAGKTTVAVQVVAGLVGILDEVLGQPLTPARRVLYLAMDRPRQIRRAMRRLFHEEHREVLAERLIVRAGPLPDDLGRRPELLLALAQQNGCDVVVVDSLKDAAVKLTDEEVGGNVNRAIQLCNAHDVDVLVLHHQRKGDGSSKPTSLSDVFGSTWLTAGAGSVLLLWGEPGAELVELAHLKQPADPVGPWQLEHDHHAGTTRIIRGFDALDFLRLRGPDGATVAEVAQAEHGSPQTAGGTKWKRTERRLRALVARGLATTEGSQQRDARGRVVAVRYTAATVDYPHGHTP